MADPKHKASEKASETTPIDANSLAALREKIPGSLRPEFDSVVATTIRNEVSIRTREAMQVLARFRALSENHGIDIFSEWTGPTGAEIALTQQLFSEHGGTLARILTLADELSSMADNLRSLIHASGLGALLEARRRPMGTATTVSC